MKNVLRSVGLWAFIPLLLAPSLLASPLSMTDYSQLNHDEPTHWTKPATTPTEQQVAKLEAATTEKTVRDLVITSAVPPALPSTDNGVKNATREFVPEASMQSESGTTAGDDLVAVGAVESFEKEGTGIAEGVPIGDETFLSLIKDDTSATSNTPRLDDSGRNLASGKAAAIMEAPTASIGTVKTEAGDGSLQFVFRENLPAAFGTPRLEVGDNFPVHDAIEKLARNRDDLDGALAVPEMQEGDLIGIRQESKDGLPELPLSIAPATQNTYPEFDKKLMSTPEYEIKKEEKTSEIVAESISQQIDEKSVQETGGKIIKRNGTDELSYETNAEYKDLLPTESNFKEKITSEKPTPRNQSELFKDQNTDFTSEIASIEAKDDYLVNNVLPERDEIAKENESTTKGTVDESNNTEQFFRYDIIEDIRNLFTNDNDMSENEVKENQLEDVLGFKGEDKVPTEDTLIVQRIEEGSYEGGYQEEEDGKKEGKRVIDSLVVPTMGEKEANYETPFSDWDRESEEQDHNMENIVFQMGNESEMAAIDLNNKGNLQGGSWFLLLLSGNATIVQKRQKDFAKYLKLNLAARLSLEYDELRVNKVVLAPPRLMVNVSVVPSENDNFDEEFDLNEKLFGEEEAPLHKLAETNATLLELSGEEYHVVRFLSLRSAQPMTMEETVADDTRQVSDKHGDIEYLIYIIVGGPCLTLIVFLIYTLYRLYLLPKNDWPWQRDKPIFSTGPRHQRMNESNRFSKPLTVIYSGSFVDRNGPPSGSWLDENYKPEMNEKVEPSLENPSYGLGSLSKNALSEICDPSVLDSPRFNVRMMGCQPAHLLLPRTPVKKISDIRPSRGLTKGLDNPNYLT